MLFPTGIEGRPFSMLGLGDIVIPGQSHDLHLCPFHAAKNGGFLERQARLRMLSGFDTMLRFEFFLVLIVTVTECFEQEGLPFYSLVFEGKRLRS